MKPLALTANLQEIRAEVHVNDNTGAQFTNCIGQIANLLTTKNQHEKSKDEYLQMKWDCLDAYSNKLQKQN